MKETILFMCVILEKIKYPFSCFKFSYWYSYKFVYVTTCPYRYTEKKNKRVEKEK